MSDMTPFVARLVMTLLTAAVIAIAFFSKNRLPARGNILAVLGSGGHTGELLTMLKPAGYRPDFVFGQGDPLSVQKAQSAGFASSQFYELPRARRVGEGKLSSCVSVLRSLGAALRLVWRVKPRMVVCNGPATCVVVVAAVRILRLTTKVVYVEGLARVRDLSLSGYLIYQLEMADEFLVQWPELASKYPGTVHRGVLV